MKTRTITSIGPRTARAVTAVALGLLCAADARAQAPCTFPLTSGLKFPLGVIQTTQRNLIVSETGDHGILHSGRISIVDLDGARRTLVDGLPSATNDVNEPAGPAGLVMRGRTLYVAIGIGDTILPVPPTPFRIANPAPSSRLFSSILAIHFSAHTERITGGFTLTPAHHEALADGRTVRIRNGWGDHVAIELVANFPDHVPNPLPPAPANVQGSNPFDLELLGDHIYATDGGRNQVWKVDLRTGAFQPLATFPPVPNPTAVGGPTIEAVPTGLRKLNGHLYVTLFRGFPFPPGTSVVERIDPRTGDHAPVLTGLRTAVDLLFLRTHKQATMVVLEHASGPLLPPFSGPGSLTKRTQAGPQVLADCLNRPTSIARDRRTGAYYITELVNGRLVMVR